MNGKVKSAFSLTPASDLMSRDMNQTFLVDGVLTRGQPAVIGGPMKSCKTWVSLDLAYSLATASPFMGRFTVPHQVRVGLISMESGGATIQANARQVALSKGVPEGPDGLFLETGWQPRLPRDREQLNAAVTNGRLDVLIVDPQYLLICDAVKNGADLYSTGRAFGILSELAAETGVTPVLVHHTTKSMAVGKLPEMSDLAGAGVGEWGRQFVLINRRRRYVPRSGRHELMMVFAGSTTRGSSWDVTVDEFDKQGRPCWRPVVTKSDLRQLPGEEEVIKRLLTLEVLSAILAIIVLGLWYAGCRDRPEEAPAPAVIEDSQPKEILASAATSQK